MAHWSDEYTRERLLEGTGELSIKESKVLARRITQSGVTQVIDERMRTLRATSNEHRRLKAARMNLNNWRYDRLNRAKAIKAQRTVDEYS